MIHTIDIKVRGYHLDLYRHVNNARYLEFLEEARWSFLESKGNIDYLHERGYTFALVNININYRRIDDSFHRVCSACFTRHSTTRSCSCSCRNGCMGRLNTSREARSDSGKSPRQ